MLGYSNLYQFVFFVNNKKFDMFFKVIDSDPAITFCRRTFLDHLFKTLYRKFLIISTKTNLNNRHSFYGNCIYFFFLNLFCAD